MQPAETESAPAAATGGGPVGRVIARPLFWVVTLTVLFLVPLSRSFLRRLPPPPPILATVPAFTMTDQLGHPFGTTDLSGKVWVADFIFTSCQTMCPVLTQKMGEIAHRGRHLGPDFHLVSFSVDPERDTPQRLAAYATAHGADAHKWTFLTGSLDAVQRAVVDGFKIGVDRHQAPPPGEPTGKPTAAATDGFWDIVHGEHLVVVDRHLQIRGYFDASTDGMNRLLEALGRVANEP
jgi:protein SCO1/2